MCFLWSLQLNWVLIAFLANKRVSKFLVILFFFGFFFLSSSWKP
jgi:hypothetical protein